MYSVLVGDDNLRWCDSLAGAIDNEPEFHVVAKAKNGKEAVSLLERFRPDVVILDIIMPELDGVNIVGYIREKMDAYDPAIYIISGLGTDNSVATLNKMGVDYYSLKPVGIQTILQNLKAMVKNKAGAGYGANAAGVTDKEIREVLLRLGVLPHRMAFECTKDALTAALKSTAGMGSLSKEIYPQAAGNHQIAVSSVEKNIRNAVLQMQKSGTELYQEIFSYKTGGSITNGEFLSVLCDYIRELDAGR